MSYTITLTKKEIHAIKNGMYKYLIEGCDKDGEDYTDETNFKLEEALENSNVLSVNSYEDKIKELKEENEKLKEQNNIYIQHSKTLHEQLNIKINKLEKIKELF